MNIEFQAILDASIVKQTLAIDSLYKNLVQDTDFRSWQPNLALTSFYHVFKDGQPFGICALERLCSNSINFHGGVFKEMRNKGTADTMKALFKELKKLTDDRVIVTMVSVKNEVTINLLKRVGLKEKCIIKNAAKSGDIMILSE